MFSMKCDLHIHTHCSDGSRSPEQVVDMAVESGLDCIAVTDHDNVSGVERAIGHAQGRIQVLAGAEISSYGTCDVHILAYNIDFHNEQCREELRHIASMRENRNVLLAEKLKEHGMEISLDSIKARKQSVVGRADIAQEMVRLGYCNSVSEAFDKYIGNGKCCFVRAKRLTPLEAIKFALRYGGIPVLAHPKNLHIPFKRFNEFLLPLVKGGLAGIEGKYFTHTVTQRRFYMRIAKKYNLVLTAGSDYHDGDHGVMLGTKHFVPDAHTAEILGIRQEKK